jgi:Dickkopf N-terminal cysteine-rich region
MRRLIIVVVALAAALACDQKGGENEECDTVSPWGWKCDPGLICNDAVFPPKCQRPMSAGEGKPCSDDQLCTSGRFCDKRVWQCRPFLKEAEPCDYRVKCGPNLYCHWDRTSMTSSCQRLPPDAGPDSS